MKIFSRIGLLPLIQELVPVNVNVCIGVSMVVDRRHQDTPKKADSTLPSAWLNWRAGFNLIAATGGLIWLLANIRRLGITNAITLDNVNIILQWCP